MASNKRGIFLSIEGTDGSGKSTQIAKIISYLQEKGKDVVLTREPGGTPISEQIREMLLDTANAKMTPLTEMLLYAAARAQHVQEKILPALAEGKIVLSDRYVDSSIAYQAYGRGLGECVKTVNEIATGGLLPDLTIFLDLSPQEGILRKSKEENHQMDRLEQEQAAFHERVYEGYLAACADAKNRVVRIDANKDVETVFSQIQAAVEQCLDLR